jgi:SAM-dependent methyltransferase
MKSVITSIKRKMLAFSSKDYWTSRYEDGRNSGAGSYGNLARFKADVLNDLVNERDIQTVIEFGCGDGNQLALARYPKYVGYDVSLVALSLCRAMFAGDASKEFFLVEDYDARKADLSMSLDVIYHLTEDRVFDAYMRRLFGAALQYVVIYSSNQEQPIEPVSIHVRHREFTKWVAREAGPDWRLAEKIPNAFPYNGDNTWTSFADFYVFERVTG